MMTKAKSITILVADDDEDDRYLVKKAWIQTHGLNNMYFVEDGEELMKYLRRSGKYADPKTSPHPSLILLDLNMPKKDGQEVLMEIRADPDLLHIPIVILTTSQVEKDIIRSYSLGANSFINKPVTFSALIEVLQSLGTYWIDTVQLPKEKN